MRVATSCGFWNMLSPAVGLLMLLPPGPRLSCPMEVVMNNRHWFSLSVPDGRVTSPVLSSSIVAWEVASSSPVLHPVMTKCS